MHWYYHWDHPIFGVVKIRVFYRCSVKPFHWQHGNIWKLLESHDIKSYIWKSSQIISNSLWWAIVSFGVVTPDDTWIAWHVLHSPWTLEVASSNRRPLQSSKLALTRALGRISLFESKAHFFKNKNWLFVARNGGISELPARTTAPELAQSPSEIPSVAASDNSTVPLKSSTDHPLISEFADFAE